ncbi:MAG TPA: hypothetical protein VLE48_14860, partial [Terriglobales bacterium]|nr:hypothetical protein [Terriglobales bacterium]
MSPFPFLQRGSLADHAKELSLNTYTPSLRLEGLLAGVDNVRHDVFLSPRFADTARQHIARLITRYGNVQDLVAEEPSIARPPSIVRPPEAAKAKADPADFKRSLVELHLAALNRAKAENNLSIDLLARLAIIKFLRNELSAQFTQTLERCRTKLKSYEGPHQPARIVEMRERFAALQIGKKSLLRRVGQDLFETLREIEKETLSRTRRSLFGEAAAAGHYDLLLNRLLFTEDGRDDYLNAEHYVMLGNYERDPDRFQTMLEISCEFLRSLNIAANGGTDDDRALDPFFSAPENAQELTAGGTPDESTPRGKSQKALLGAWVDLLEKQQVMDHVIASYEAVPLLAQYSPPINAQQLKNALISRTERKRVETLLEEHGKISTDGLHSAVKRVGSCKGAERAKIAGRFLGDFMRYHRDLRRFEALNSAMDSVNVVATEKLRELSAINSTLYEFLLAEEQKPVEDKVIHHVVIKADVRDSTTLTRTLMERGLNPASYFSLNFYDPVNKLLAKYGATKVFIEGDALILALFGREGEPSNCVARACVLAREMLEIVQAYNQKSRPAGLPILELGIGVCFEDSAPLYLMDGNQRIMISRALNESDRLSSCSKGARKLLGAESGLFNVYAFQTVEDVETAGAPEELMLHYNVSGIHI